jgi:hypothetical protein
MDGNDISNLIEHVNIYNMLDKRIKDQVFNTWKIYDEYEDINNIFDRMNERKILNLVKKIKKYINQHMSNDMIMKRINGWHVMVRFILDHYKEDESDESEEDKEIEKVLKKTIVTSDYEEYQALQKYCINTGIWDKYDYDKEYKKYCNLFSVDKHKDMIKVDPKERFPFYFRNWYDFLQIETEDYVETLDEWREGCVAEGVTDIRDYKKLCKKNGSYPTMPEELYQGFTNLEYELKIIKPKNTMFFL